MSFKRRLPLITGEYYHVYNRSIGKASIFEKTHHLYRAIETIDYYRHFTLLSFSKFQRLTGELKYEFSLIKKKQQPLVEIYAFSLMPNHFHFELKQLVDNGIQKFLTNFQNSYAKYYNTIEERVGGLFQDRFKAKRINTAEEFTHVSRYIHLNPVTSSLISFEELAFYPFSSYMWYLNPLINRFVNTEVVLNHFKSLSHYSKFISNHVAYQKKIKKIRRLLIDG
ncbi:MAG: transposase [Candidatus Roizmanbacteria bacterium]|nr:MAG: transposase [Candidatus Roizmanbacteria bacterium]